MEKLTIISFAVLGFAGLVLYLKNGNRFTEIVGLLAFVGVGLFMLPGFEKEDHGLHLLGVLLSLACIALVLNVFVKSKIKVALGIVLGALSFIFYGKTFDFLGYPLLFNEKNGLLVSVSGIAFPLLARLKMMVLSKIYGDRNTEVAVNFALSGILMLIALFFGEVFGLFLMGLMVFIMELLLEDGKEVKHYTFWYFLIAAPVFFVYNNSGFDPVSLLHYSVFLGMFLGASSGTLLNILPEGTELNLKKVTYPLLIVLFAGVILYMETIKEHTGGFQGFVGFVLALLLVTKNNRLVAGASAALLSFSLLLVMLPKLAPKISDEAKTDTKVEEAAGENHAASLDLSTIAGDWKIDPSKSSIKFQLGPKDSRTEGEFKSLEGMVTIGQNLEESLFDVKVPVSGFTTFNDYRDEGLMEADYLDAAKHKNILFNGSKIKKEGSSFILEGEVNLRGMREKVTVDLILVSFDEGSKTAVLKAKSKLDRTKHGMTSDPKIGDVVDFEVNFTLTEK